MCIVLVTWTKRYKILLSNRDEFLDRPTLHASWWPSPDDTVFAGRDLVRPSHGTWLGITRQGRIVVLTNYHETEEGVAAAPVLRGEFTREFLISKKPVNEWVQEVLENRVYRNVGRFSLMCSILKKGSMEGYAVISNRSCVEIGADYIVLTKEDDVLGYECLGLSNAFIHDEWPKVKMGKILLAALAKEDIKDEDSFINKCFDLLMCKQKLFELCGW
jgi:uncharacterized protein with NRDE domain